MWPLRRFVRRLFNAVRPDRAEPDLAREIASHLALLEDEFQRRGMTAEDARLAARRAFGGVEQAKEIQRDARSFRWLNDARQDARYAVRMLRRAPGFTAVAVLTLALGIGANSAIFTVVHAVLMRPLPYPEPGRLVGIVQLHTSGGPEFATWPDYTDWRDRATSLESLGGAWSRVYNLTGVEEPERLAGAAATATLFTTLGVAPQLGGTFNPDGKGDPRTVVLSHRLWQRRFGSAQDAIGRTVSLNGTAHTVIGVMPPGFAWPQAAELWVPFVPEPGMTRGYHLLQVVGRLRRDATLSSRARGARDDRGGVRGRVPREQAVGGSHLFAARAHRGIDEPIAADPRRRRGVRAAHRLRECRRTADLARAGAEPGDLGAKRAWRQPGANHPAAADGEPRALDVGRSDRAGPGGAGRFPGCSRLTTLPRADGVALDATVFAVTLLASVCTGLLFGVAPAAMASRTSLPALSARAAPEPDGCGRRCSSSRSPRPSCCWPARGSCCGAFTTCNRSRPA